MSSYLHSPTVGRLSSDTASFGSGNPPGEGKSALSCFHQAPAPASESSETALLTAMLGQKPAQMLLALRIDSRRRFEAAAVPLWIASAAGLVRQLAHKAGI